MHDCPECGQACYCGGDIDDIDVGDQQAIQGCTHCSDLPDKDYGDDYEGWDESKTD